MIEVFERDLLKLDILRKYTFAQYTVKARGVGTFKILARLVDENLYLLDETKQYYFLFEGKYLYKAEKIHKQADSDFEETIEISGRHINYIFTKRVVNGTFNFSGLTYEMLKSMIEIYLTKNDRFAYKMNINFIYDNEQYLQRVCSQVQKQVTGGYVWDEIEPIMNQDGLCIMFTPVVTTEEKYIPTEQDWSAIYWTNIAQWDLVISAGADRRKGNKEGNVPVVFSQSISNVSRADFEIDWTDYTNVAYIAGEGEGENRVWKKISGEIMATRKSQLAVSELWIDARDVQKETEGGTLDDQSYYNLLVARANEKFAENKKNVFYDSTIDSRSVQYVFGTDYFLGDMVTIIDDQLGISFDAQITSFTKSVQDGNEILDIGYTKGERKEDVLTDIKRIKSTVSNQEANIRYLVSTVQNIVTKNSIANMIYPVGTVLTFANDSDPNSLFPGMVWEEIGQGRTLIGKDASDAEFDTVEKTGGDKKTVNLFLSGQNYGGLSGGTASGEYKGRVWVSPPTYINHDTNATDIPQSIVQPYYVVRFWKRVS